jgi:microcystin-dependent protein
MANYEATRYDFDGANLTGIEGIPTGTITPWSQATPPSGFLECDGAEVSRSTYAALFAIIGTTYGVGDGSTTFDLPDLTDKVAVHKSNNKAFASTAGANTVTPTGNVAGSTANATLSTAQLASHSHPINGIDGGTSPLSFQIPSSGPGTTTQVSPRTININNAGSGQGHSHNMSANFAGDANSVLQPYLTLIYIIKT